MRKRTFVILSAFFLFYILPVHANASAILDISDDGQLLGASDVLVADSLFDVQFLDGTYNELFPSGSPFRTIQDAEDAAQSLLDNVFVDIDGYLFDTNPELTNGSISEVFTIVLTPVAMTLNPYLLYAVSANNIAPEYDEDRTVLRYLDYFGGDTEDTRDYGNMTWAVWNPVPAPVPEPSTWLLLGTGLAGLFYFRRKRL